jgi:hypothetical protein
MGGDELGGEKAWQRLLATVASARRELDRMEFEAVQTVREAGATWEEIGDALGISRQAARQRFGQPRRRR